MKVITNIPATDVTARSILNALMEQIHNGIWATRSKMQPMHGRVEEEDGNIVIDTPSLLTTNKDACNKYALLLKKAAKTYIGDHPHDGLVWKRSCAESVGYLDYYDESRTTHIIPPLCEVYRIYDKLLGRKDYFG